MVNRKAAGILACVFLVGIAVTTVAERPKKGTKSPWQYVQQMIGDSLVEIEYYRPGVKGRVVWGDLVPYGELWRAGANDRTVISFEDDVLVNGQPLKAGFYALFILPTKDEWTFVFNKAADGHGLDGYSKDLDVLRIKAKPEAAEHEEWLQIGVTDFKENAANVYVHWEKVRCSFKVELAN
jgi:hypothetical protein